MNNCRKSVPAFVILLVLSLTPVAFVHQSFASSCVPPPSGMISWWTGDDNAQDLLGVNHGTLMNNASFADGKVGRAFSLDGVDDYVTVPDSASLDVTGTISIDAWIYRNDATAEAGLLEKGAPGTNGVYELAIYDHKFYFRLNGAGLNMPSVTSLPVGTWTHVAGTYDGTTAKIYINGILDATQAYSASIGTDNNPLYIGLYGTATKHFPGLIDELEIFNRALLAEEIAAIYSAGSAGKCKPQCTPPPSDMVSWWGGDNNALDMVGTNHGILMADAAYAPGKVGQAFSLSGNVDSYIEIANNPSLNPSGAFTVDGWFYIDPSTMVGGKTDAVLAAKTNGDVSDGGWQLVFVTGRNGWTNALRFLVMGGGQYPSAILDGAITSAGWYHVAGVYDTQAPGILKLYLNGLLVASDSSGVTMANNSRNLRIGASYWADNDRLNGKADEVEFFNRALTADEVEAIYNSGSAGKCRSCTPPPSNMLSWWRAEDNADDATGANNGTLMNGAAFATGKVGRAFSFDGVDDYLRIPDSLLFNLSALTFETWFRTISGGVILGYQHEDALIPSTNHVPALYVGTDNKLYAELWAGFGLEIVSGQTVTDGNWHHAVLTYENLELFLFLDGISAGSVAGEVSHIDMIKNQIGTGNTAGWPAGNGDWFSFNGLIDEVGIYSRALSADEITAIYNAGSAGKCFVSHNVTSSAPGGNGTLSCTGPVLDGYDSTCTITPDAGYYLSGLADNTIDVLDSVIGGTYTIPGVTGTHDIVATFARYPVWRDGTTGYFMTIGDAYGDGSMAYTIKAHGVELTDSDLDLSGSASVVIDGGYLPDFSGYSGVSTTITGSLKIGGAGAVTVSNIAVQ